MKKLTILCTALLFTAALLVTRPQKTYADEITLKDGDFCSVICAGNRSETLDIAGSSMSDKADIQIWHKNDTGAQRFKVIRNSDETWTFYVMSSGMAITADGTERGSRVCQSEFCASDTQKWNLQNYDDGTVAFLNVASGLALDVSGGLLIDGSSVQIWEANDTAAQKFLIVRRNGVTDLINNGAYTINSAKAENEVIDIAAASKEDKANVQIYTSNGSDAQKFIARKQTDGTWTFINMNSGKVLDIDGDKKEDGTNVQQYTSNSSEAQKWRLLNNRDGTVTILGLSSGLALDTVAGSMSDGANVELCTSNGSASQKFTINYDMPYMIPDVKENSVTGFLEHIKSVWQEAYDNNWVYGNSTSIIPCEDGIISCDRLIARALWDMGYQDQQAGGMTIFTEDEYLTSHGFTKITDERELQSGDIVLFGLADGTPDHTVVLTSFNGIDEPCSRYDCGCIELIRGGQPVTSLLNYNPEHIFLAGYRIDE